jgi:pimeloyl-ACP methyl ester carboxylesterase
MKTHMAYYKHIEGTINSPEIVILHGLGSHKYHALKWSNYYLRNGYSIHALTSNGAGNQPGKVFSWGATVKKFASYIENLHKRVIVIGHSMGGTEAICLAQCRNVSKVFAIGALHDDIPFYNLNVIRDLMAKLPRFAGDLRGRKIAEVMQWIKPALPVNLKLSRSQTTKIHLIHQRGDFVVPYSQFEKNREMFNVSKSRCLVKFQIGHLFLPNLPSVQRWILKQIESKM